MIESVLTRNHASLRVKITVKALVSAGIVVWEFFRQLRG